MGTVIVSYSLGVISSAAVLKSAAIPAVYAAQGKAIFCPSDSIPNPHRKETSSMAALPSQDFLPSVSLHFTLCFPNGIPIRVEMTAKPTRIVDDINKTDSHNII